MFDDDPRWGSDPGERDDDTRDRDAVLGCTALRRLRPDDPASRPASSLLEHALATVGPHAPAGPPTTTAGSSKTK